MYTDSHCHLDFDELRSHLPLIKEAMRQSRVNRALCISVQLEKFSEVLAVANTDPNWYATVGVHPDYEKIQEPDVATLVALAQHPKVIGIGETGLDYYRLTGNLEWQRQRFRTHIQAACQCRKPLIIHTRQASEDTLRVLDEERGERAGGVFHCFTESQEVAQAVLDRGFYLSFSGIITFKSAVALREVVKFVPLDRFLIETDSPYLAPVPHRGQRNQPSYVVEVAAEIGHLKGLTRDEVGEYSSANFSRLFSLA